MLRAALLVLLASCGAGGAAVRAPRGPQEARIASDRAARVFVLEPGGHMVEAGSLRPGAAAVVQVPPEAREPWPVVLLAVDGRSLAFEGVEPGRTTHAAGGAWQTLGEAGRSHVQRALAREVEVGMPASLVVLAWGLPHELVNSASVGLGRADIWRYTRPTGDVLVYMTDGRVDRVRRF